MGRSRMLQFEIIQPQRPPMFFIIPKEEDKFERAYLVRKKLSVSVNISSLMNFFESVIKPTTKPLKQLVSVNLSIFNINAGLQHAFISKTRLQKIEFYCHCVQFLERVIRSPNDPSINSVPAIDNPVVILWCYLKSKLLGRWDRVNLRINKQTRKLVIVQNKTEIILTLDNYFCRRSKDASRKGLVLQPISATAETSILRLGFQDDCFEEVAKTIESMVWEATRLKFLRELKDGLGDVREVSLNNFGCAKEEETCDTRFNGDDIIGWTSYINEEILDEFRQFQESFLTPERRMKKGSGDVVVCCSSKRILEHQQNVYYLNELFMMSQANLTAALKIPSDKWNKHIRESVLIEKPEYEHLQVVYERCKHKEKTFDYMYLRQDTTSDFTEIVIQPVPLKSNITELNGCHFQYVYIRVQAISEEQCRLLVEIKPTKSDFHQLIVGYLSEFSNLQAALDKDRLQIQPKPKWVSRRKDMKSESQLVSVESEVNKRSEMEMRSQLEIDSSNIRSEAYMEQPAEEESHQVSMIELPVSFSKPTHLKPEVCTNVQDSYLQVEHCTTAKNPDGPKKLTMKHYLFEDWQVAKTGGVICNNEAMINEQKKVFGYVIKSIGKNIFKSKNILNISLPVTIFKKESHLESMARNLSFAPILLEKASASDPIEAMKWAVVYLVTVGVVGISMEKPFNPLLGETYQGWIDGCPVWLEQISHHPPISAYLMQGRGYKTCGKIEPKVQLGMNSVKGLSDHENLIEFEDGRVLRLTFMKMVIHGLLFGDRQFNFQAKNYVYDSVNCLFAEISFGPKKSSYFGKNEHPLDYMYGRIVKVTPSYQTYKQLHGNKAWPEKQHIVEQLSKFEGVWTEQISFDGTKYFDFRTDLPPPVIDDLNPLKSHSSYRKDIQMLRAGRLQQSQTEKQRIEEVQRRDRRLRESHHKGSH